MSNITYKSVKIEITYSNSETEREGVKVGDKFEASQEYFNGKPKMQCWFNVNGTNCVAYACQHDEDAQIKITTCKILKK